jgi:molybdopterin synthase catalytic subunit
MSLLIQLSPEPIPATLPPPVDGPGVGAVAEFRGLVRGEEKGTPITALVYEAYDLMARREITRILDELVTAYPCLGVRVIHRLGRVPVGEAAIYIGVAARHRAEAFTVLSAFMDRLKQDVPIWKTEVIPA